MNVVEKTLFKLVDIDDYEEVQQLTNMYDIMVEDDGSFTLDCGVISHNSAIGALIKVRNPKTTGGYPLRGKPLNVRGMKPLDIVKNKEMFELMSILGLEIGKPAENLNYGKIAIFTDSDTDGDHCFCLLLNFFSLWPELFEQKRIYRMVAPLYFCTKGKDTKIFYSTNEFNNANLKGYNIDYFKGLGSMPEQVYAQCVNEPNLIQVTADDMNKLEMAFGEKAELRKDWLLSV